MKVISIFNQKGGVGKTTTNINLSSYLAYMGYKVLTIDIDPQGNTTSGLGFDKKSLNYSIYDVLTNENISIEEVEKKCELVSNLFLIPSTLSVAGAEVEIIGKPNREKILLNKLNKINKYDYVFIDCPPSLGLLTINALCCSDSVLIPLQCEFYALEGVGQLINTVNLVKKSLNKQLSIEGVIMSMYDSRTNLSNEVINEVKKYFENKVYNTTIPRNVRLAEAPSFGLPIMLYDDKCKGAEAYVKLTKEFLSRQRK